MSGDEGGVVAGEEERGASDLVGGPESAQRNALGGVPGEFLALLG